MPFVGKKSIKHQIMLEVVGDTQARQLYIDGFEKLTTKEKIFAYYLTQAGIAGRDIFYDQHHKNALKIRNLCEEILTHAKQVDPDTYQKIKTYAHRLWLNGCQYFYSSKKKFSPDCTFQEFYQAVQNAAHNGANFKIPAGQSLADYISSLRPSMFDSHFQPKITVRIPPSGEDIISASANNFYEGITLAELNEWSQQGLEKYPINSKLIKKNDTIVEKVYRTGIPDSGIAVGMYAPQLRQVIKYLKLALPYGDSTQAKIINYLIKFYKTGNLKYINRSTLLWLNNNPRVDFLQGFIEIYTDPIGKKGSFESLVYFRDEDKTEVMNKLVELAPYFEAKAPYSDKYKRTKFNFKPTVIAALVISGMGDGGPITPAGLNLPNDQRFRETYGSKNLIFTNIMGISGGNTYLPEIEYARKYVYEFFHPADIEVLKKVHQSANFAMVCLHELIGHGSGKANPNLKGDPLDYLQEYYSTIEEARAELMALWNLHDPKLLHIGLVPSKNAADEIYRQWARYDLIQLCYMENRETIGQDHERARHLIINYVRDKGDAIDMVKIKGKLYTKVKSIKKFKQAVAELLSEIMRIKAEGDYEAAKELVQTYGIYFNKEWRDQMVDRYKKFQQEKAIIKHRGFSMPILIPIKDNQGNIKNIKLKYLKDFEKEQLYYSGKLEIK